MGTDPVTISVRRLAHAAGLPLPAPATTDAAGVDLVAALEPGTELVLKPGERDIVPTGLAMALPGGYEAQVRPRSGLALKHGVTVLNSPGTIDADYRGEIKVILINLGDQPVALKRGDRIAQLVVAPVSRVALAETDRLDTTARGEGGFGSTGGGAAQAGK